MKKLKFGISYAADPAAYQKVQARLIRKENPIRYIFNQAKYRAKQRGHKFTIKIDQIKIPTHCPVFGTKLKFSPGRRTDNSYSIDRVDSRKGYVPGNVQIISWGANRIKGGIKLKEIEAIYKYMRKYHP